MRWLFIFLVFPLLSWSAELRSAYIKAREEYLRSKKELSELKKAVGLERERLRRLIKEKRSKVNKLKREIERKREELAALYKKEEELLKEKEKVSFEMDELVGGVRVFSKDVRGVLIRSPFTAFKRDRLSFVEGLLGRDTFPSMADIKRLTNVCFEEMKLSGSVSIMEGEFVVGSGKRVRGEILALGPFTLYTTDGDLLMYDPDKMELVSLGDKTPWTVKRVLKGYVSGKREDVYVDISGGAGLNQLINKLGFSEQLRKGGPIAVVILVLGLFSAFLIVYKFMALRRIPADNSWVLSEVEKRVKDGDFAGALEFLKGVGGPISRVLAVGIENRGEDKETLESLLEEAVLKEIPGIERFLSTLQIVAAIAPLLGLLGTVTGMISTFHSITLFGVGNPRMMSGGISEALITTEFGLMVAIPVMFFHSLLSKKVDAIVAGLEEAANFLLVALGRWS